jgi:hypothetical protein
VRICVVGESPCEGEEWRGADLCRFMTLFILGSELAGLGLAGFGHRVLVSSPCTLRTTDPDCLNPKGGTSQHDLAFKSRHFHIPKHVSRRGRTPAGAMDEVSVLHRCLCRGVCILFLTWYVRSVRGRQGADARV